MSSDDRPVSNLRAGLVGLCCFAVLGISLEALHAFKLGLYLDVSQDTRRLLWRLAHAHGVLLGLVNVVYALVARAWPELRDELAGRALIASLWLMPLGFLLGGAFAHGGDPGIGIVVAIMGAVALVFALGKLAYKAK
jgi:hypothetical protein